jgi:CheY-like chemotaxis protein
LRNRPVGAKTCSVRILIVDDDEEFAAEVARFLTEHGHDVSLAGNVPLALSTVEVVRPEVVFIDMVLPVFGGNDLAAAIRAQSSPPRLIAMTGWRERADPELFETVVSKDAARHELLPLLSPDRPAPRTRRGSVRQRKVPSGG